MLKTERITRTMEARILRAARKALAHHKPCTFEAVFEHSHWWIVISPKGYDQADFWDKDVYNYSVNDAEGPGTVDGFSFEEV